MNDWFLLHFLSEEDQFSDLKDIANKIIPDDPWAFVVQLLATLILVIILSVFLVKPVKKYVQQRTQYIQGNLDEANEKRTQAERMLNEATTSLKQAKVESRDMVEHAKVIALNEKDKIVSETQSEVAMMREKAHQDIANERKQMKEQLSSEMVDVAMLAASKVIERNINDEDSKKMVSSFIEDNQ